MISARAVSGLVEKIRANAPHMGAHREARADLDARLAIAQGRSAQTMATATGWGAAATIGLFTATVVVVIVTIVSN